MNIESCTVSRRLFLAGTLGGAAVTVGACSVPGTDSGAVGRAPATSGEISLLTALVPETLNPLAGFANTGKGKINESLLTLSGRPDALPEIVPHLAAQPPEVSADELTWTVTLKRGVTFSDGTALTAADVVATYEAIADPATASPIAGDLVNLEKVEATDDHTVVFRLRASQVSFRTALLIGIAPKAMITTGQKVEESPLNQKPIGTGPYVVESYDTDRLVLAAKQGPPRRPAPGHQDHLLPRRRRQHPRPADAGRRLRRLGAPTAPLDVVQGQRRHGHRLLDVGRLARSLAARRQPCHR